MEADFCVAALKDALEVHGTPDIFNTDQGSQFTSHAFTGALAGAGVRISMNGRGRWMDNVFIERLWRSLKYECVFLNAFETGSEARTASIDGSTSTTGGVRTRRWATGRPTRSMLSKSSRRIWRPEPSRTHLSKAANLSQEPVPAL